MRRLKYTAGLWYHVMVNWVRPLRPFVCVLVGFMPVELSFASLFKFQPGFYISVVSLF